MQEFFEVIFDFINSIFEDIAEALKAGDTPRAIKKAVNLLAAGLGLVGFLALILALLYAGRKAIIAVVGPIIMAIVLVKSYQLNHPSTSTEPVQQPGTIELARARAEKVYPLLTQTAFLLVSELCRYLPGLVKPFSLKDIVPKVHYGITASFITIYHFIIAKGDCETERQTMQEILETIIDQHLQAHDLPFAIQATYTSADGDIFPGLMVDGIYDSGNYYRLDLVITNEAQVTRFRTIREDCTTNGVIVHDEDFD